MTWTLRVRQWPVKANTPRPSVPAQSVARCRRPWTGSALEPAASPRRPDPRSVQNWSRRRLRRHLRSRGLPGARAPTERRATVVAAKDLLLARRVEREVRRGRDGDRNHLLGRELVPTAAAVTGLPERTSRGKHRLGIDWIGHDVENLALQRHVEKALGSPMARAVVAPEDPAIGRARQHLRRESHSERVDPAAGRADRHPAASRRPQRDERKRRNHQAERRQQQSKITEGRTSERHDLSGRGSR